MKLQKLLYFAHGWHLALHNKPLLDENFEAWAYGPALPSVYQRYKTFRNSAIIESSFDEINAIDKNTKDFLDFIWKLYKNYTAIQLSNLTHVRKSPWDNTYNGHRELGNVNSNVIKNMLIKDYFKRTYLPESVKNGL